MEALIGRVLETVWLLYYLSTFYLEASEHCISGSCHKRQKPQAPTPQVPVRNRQTRKVAYAKGRNRNTNLTLPNLT